MIAGGECTNDLRNKANHYLLITISGANDMKITYSRNFGQEVKTRRWTVGNDQEDAGNCVKDA